MLNSILQQKGTVPPITVNISYLPSTGNPTTESLCEFFKKEGMNIKELHVPENEIHNRAYARQKQIEKTESDWLIFADSDMVYDPYFFDDLHKQVEGPLKDIPYVMGADRHSLDIDFCVKYFNEDKREYPCLVENVAELVSHWPVMHIHGRNIAAGNFQLASLNRVIETGRKYTNSAHDRWRKTKADRHFRLILGGRTGIKTKPMYHLNHDRGGPDVQR